MKKKLSSIDIKSGILKNIADDSVSFFILSVGKSGTYRLNRWEISDEEVVYGCELVKRDVLSSGDNQE